MAPEQVRGETVDERTNIFAFGAVLYEMLTGQRAFQRHSSIETMAAILKEDPPEIHAREERGIPPALERIVHRCLEKNPGQRFQSAKDLSFALENISGGTTQQQAVLSSPSKRNFRHAITLALVVLAVPVLVFAVRGFLAHPQQPNYQQLTFRDGSISSARFGSDGATVVYSAAWGNPLVKLYSSHLDGTDVVTVAKYGLPRPIRLNGIETFTL